MAYALGGQSLVPNSKQIYLEKYLELFIYNCKGGLTFFPYFACLHRLIACVEN